MSRVRLEGIGTVPYVFLFEDIGESGETVDELAGRIAPRLVAYSDATGFEACGVMAKHNDGRWGTVIGSNQSHVACANLPDRVPEGFRAMALTIHSHGLGGGELNQTDLRFLKLSADSRSKHMHGQIYGQDRHQFSERDLTGLPGYLATPDGLLRHDGKGKRWVVQTF